MAKIPKFERDANRRALNKCRKLLKLYGPKTEVFAAIAWRLDGVEWHGGIKHGYELARQLAKEEALPAKTVVANPFRTAKRDQRTVDAFLLTFEWRRLRMQVIVERGNRCECCGKSPKDGIVINVDHIKPRKTHPELALEKSNLQILCDVCNHGKGNWDSTDWRTA